MLAKSLPVILLGCCLLAMPFEGAAFAGAVEATYVGADACQSCHEDQYASFQANSGKAHSWKSVEKMLPKLTTAEQRECFACHTTGYGQPGGFTGLADTPRLANLSCETCHGPGSLHAETGDTDAILRTPDRENCVTCHNADRIQNFNFKPILYHGGH